MKMDAGRSIPGVWGGQLQARSNPIAQPLAKSPGRQGGNIGFYLVMTYLLFEFGRPQELIPGIRVIPFGTGLSVLLFIQVVMAGKLDFSRAQTKLWILLFAVMAIHIPIARNNFWALMTFKDMLLLFFVYMGIVTFVDTTARMVKLVQILLIIHVFLAVMGIAKGGSGVGGWMGDENDFCMAINMIIPFAYFMLFSTTSVFLKLRYLGYLGLFILAAMTTLSRGGFIGLAAVGTYCWYRSPKKLNAFLVVVVAVLFMALLAPETYWDEIASSTSDETMGQDGTGGARLYTWGIGMEMFFSNPIIGIGQSNFPWTFEIYEDGRTFNTRSIAGRQAHSAWVTLLAELGFAGIITIGGMIVCCFMDLKSIRRKFAPPELNKRHAQEMKIGEDIRAYLARAMEGSLIGFIVSSVFISTLWYPSLWIMIGFVVALRNIADREEGQIAVADPIQPRYQRSVQNPYLGKARPDTVSKAFSFSNFS